MSHHTLEKITISDHRLISTVSDNIKNIHEHLALGHQIVATAPDRNIFFVLTDPEHIREAGNMYMVCKRKRYRVHPHNVFFVPPGLTLL